jgi:Cu-Zn family superoxide dismutase
MTAIFRNLKTTILMLGLSVVILVYGCQQDTPVAGNQTQTAQATINSTSDPSQTMGNATFSLTGNEMTIEANINNAPPGKHGFHIHEIGNCSAQGNAAQGHFNPDGVKHGFLPKDGFANAHAGDLGNITIGPDGTGTFKETVEGLTFKQGQYAVAGLSVILHEKEDDFGQPTGNAGGRIGCGIITATEA